MFNMDKYCQFSFFMNVFQIVEKKRSILELIFACRHKNRWHTYKFIYVTVFNN